MRALATPASDRAAPAAAAAPWRKSPARAVRSARAATRAITPKRRRTESAAAKRLPRGSKRVWLRQEYERARAARGDDQGDEPGDYDQSRRHRAKVYFFRGHLDSLRAEIELLVGSAPPRRP